MAPKTKPKRVRGSHFFRAWREAKFPNQADAEEALGWSQSKVSRLESGRTPYNQDDLEVAAEVYGCTPVDLISRRPGDPKHDLDRDALTDAITVIENYIKSGQIRPKDAVAKAEMIALLYAQKVPVNNPPRTQQPDAEAGRGENDERQRKRASSL